MLSTKLIIVAAILLAILASVTIAQEDRPAPAAAQAAEKAFIATYDAYVEKYKPLYIESNTAWWEASITGTDEAFDRRKKAEEAIIELHADTAMFSELKALRASGEIRDPMLARMLHVMYYNYLERQGDPEIQKQIVGLEADVEQIFNTHRGEIDGQPRTENDIREILSTTTDSALAEKAWKAYMEVGAKVDPKLRELVTLRNQMAVQLGYPNYFAMKLDIDEIGVEQLIALFDELDSLTSGPFAELKGRIDTRMSARFSVTPEALRPWHFGDLFFQEAPSLEDVRLDDFYAGKDLVGATRKYYASMGMDIDDILSRSDMLEREGKSPHAFCTHIDREGDIRVLCNMKDNAYWADTVVHEVGHAVYDKYVSRDLPWLLRDPAHTLTTEGVAMLFGAMSKHPEFLNELLGVTGPPEALAAARRSLRAEKLIFSRWTQVMVRFEHGMYTNPEQNLGQLWWDLKKRYQSLNPPEDVNRPDYGAKIHVVAAPVYYHGYMMGELFACQVHNHVARKVLRLSDPLSTSLYGKEQAGAFLMRDVFQPGNRWSWNDLTQRVTGEPLTARYFAEQYVK